MEGLCSPRPFMDTMPLVYRGDPLAEQLCASFDDVLAPIFATLDCLPAYLDPKTAPADMLDWLAGWIGLTVSAHEEPARKRELITAGAALLPWRGTVRSVHEAVVAAFNRETEVIESGVCDVVDHTGLEARRPARAHPHRSRHRRQRRRHRPAQPGRPRRLGEARAHPASRRGGCPHHSRPDRRRWCRLEAVRGRRPLTPPACARARGANTPPN